MDRQQAALHRIREALRGGGEIARQDVVEAMAEIGRLQNERRQWQDRVRSLEYERDAAYDNDNIPLGAKVAVAELRAIYAKTSPNIKTCRADAANSSNDEQS